MTRPRIIDEPDRYPLRFICPRECPSPRTVHCVGTDTERLRCDFCGKYMPTEDAIDFNPEEHDGQPVE